MSLIDKNLDDVTDLKKHPAGRYSGKIVSGKFKQKDDEKYSLSIAFRADEALDDVDLEGVQMTSYVYYNAMVTEKSLPIVKRDLKNAGVNLDGVSLKAAIAELEGQEAEFEVGVTKYDRDNGRDDRISVLSFKLAA